MLQLFDHGNKRNIMLTELFYVHNFICLYLRKKYFDIPDVPCDGKYITDRETPFKYMIQVLDNLCCLLKHLSEILLFIWFNSMWYIKCTEYILFLHIAYAFTGIDGVNQY